MKRNKIAKDIRIQRKQDKNHMVGQAANPSGVTSEMLQYRRNIINANFKAMSMPELIAYYLYYIQVTEDWQGSWLMEWNVFREYKYIAERAIQSIPPRKIMAYLILKDAK